MYLLLPVQVLFPESDLAFDSQTVSESCQEQGSVLWYRCRSARISNRVIGSYPITKTLYVSSRDRPCAGVTGRDMDSQPADMAMMLEPFIHSVPHRRRETINGRCFLYA